MGLLEAIKLHVNDEVSVEDVELALVSELMC